MEKHRGNFKLLILRKLRRILKMFISSFSEIVKKFWWKVRNILYNFSNVLMEISWRFCVNFWKNLWKILRKTWNYFKNILKQSGEIMFLLAIRVVLLPTQHLCFDTQKFYWAYAASLVHILYGWRTKLSFVTRLSQATKLYHFFVILVDGS